MSSRQEQFSGTREVLVAHQFDPEPLQEYMLSHVEGFHGPLSVRQFKGGQSNPTYLLESPSGRYVLRRKPPGKLLKSAHAVEREFRVISALYAADFPVPRPYVLCEDEEIVGTTFFIMEYVEGRIFWELDMPGSDAGERAARQISRWSRQYVASETKNVPAMNKLMEWLPGNIPDDESASIVHGDFRLDNMIIHPQEPRIIAVLDWELSTIGHPLGDFTYHLMAWQIPEIGIGSTGLKGKDLGALGIPTEEDYVTAYCARTGRADGIANRDFYSAYNLFRMAAILQGIAGRVRDGTAASVHAERAANAVAPLATLGWEYAQNE
jgi:aminoglycoside phosphotransferase (APT) family kinase protein